MMRPAVRRCLAIAAIGIFAAHAACYLYFFVDDEAIPLVYARHLLQGRGLSYTALEGRVEGYSDFLHVLWSAVLLLAAHAVHLSRLQVIDVSSMVNFALGAALFLILGRILRHVEASAAACVAAYGCLMLAGPLAMWSCSSLEAVPFAFAMTAMAALILPGMPAPPRYLPAIVAGVLLLERLDGFVYLGALLVAVVLFSDATHRRIVWRQAIVPALAIGAVYHAARFAYFGSLLSAPLEAKVLYKVFGGHRLVTKAPAQSYLAGFAALYGPLLAPALGAAIAAAWRSRTGRTAALTAAFMAAYIQVVGDWMFGWRFLLPVLPLVVVVIGIAVNRAPRRLAWALAAIVVAWSGMAAHRFAQAYMATEERPIWWTARHLGDSVWLAPYGDLLSIARRTIARGDVIAYNQAGLLPFVLDADNIDDLGICSKFEAELPTTDVFFTEVGRYSPLTDAPVFNAPHAYLLYRDVRVLISRTDLLRNANGGRVPNELLGGFFRLAATDASDANALYTRSERDASAYRRDPSLFWQNLVHTSRLRRVDVDGQRITANAVGDSFPFLRSQAGTLTIRQRTRIDIRFAERDEDVYAIYAGAISADHPVSLTMNLYDATGRLVASEDAQPDPSPAPLLTRYATPIRARLLSIEAVGSAPISRLTIADLRVEGQSTQLSTYVRRRLSFPAP